MHYVSGADESRFKRLKSFELSFDQFGALARLAHSLGLLFISTPFDLESANFLAGTADALKIASGDNNFYPLIARAAESGKPLIVSTGLSDLAQVKRTVKFIEDKWGARRAAGHLAILHCISAYPVPPEQANLRAIPFLAKLLSCTVGYSDHTLGLEAAVTAVALGARIIEKHFTLDKNYSSFRDHQLSADFFEMSELVKRVQLVNSMLGRPEKKVLAAEEGNIAAIRRSIVAGRDLPQGHRIALADLTWIRPGGGLEPGSEPSTLPNSPPL
ncbi:MAG: N-acetylneuraminate synthase family protein [Candidatus Sungbacteria bacterium]|uniref:N-acetylneuraminate synthase family protein n=1 Tax=Candidatus Sungiibacteriota bacterium TaxID=2750080 RepID=A0A931WNI5_9BACT|nr:N-acetylneuraminate synthase family protein [Candidatus Sungbacteria bacterium]